MPSAVRAGLATLAAALFVVAFLVLLIAAAVRVRIADPDYYKSALSDADAFERLYQDLLDDPSFGEGQASLLGNIRFPEAAVVRIVERVVPPDSLEAAVDFVITFIVDFVKDGGDLRIRLDITPFIERLRSIIPEETQSQVEAAPEEQATDDETLIETTQRALVSLRQGELPERIPSGAFSAAARDRISETILDTAGLDPSNPEDHEAINNVEAQLDNGSLRGAIRAAVSPAIEARLDSARQRISESERVEIEGEGDDRRVYLVPTSSVVSDVETYLELAHNIYVASFWIFVGSAVVMALAVAAIAFLYRRRLRTMLRWLGTAMVVGGLLAIIGWVAGLPLARRELNSLLAPEESRLPDAYLEIVKDVLQEASSSLGLMFWLPGLILILLGIGVWLLTILAPRFSQPPKETLRAGSQPS